MYHLDHIIQYGYIIMVFVCTMTHICNYGVIVTFVSAHIKHRHNISLWVWTPEIDKATGHFGGLQYETK